jgi:hypothetical protein
MHGFNLPSSNPTDWVIQPKAILQQTIQTMVRNYVT